MKYQKITSIATIAIISLIVIGVANQNNETLAEETKDPYPAANNVKIHTVMTFNQGVEESDGFQVFIQNKGFNEEKETPQFQLIGAVDSDKRMLYNTADYTFERGLSDQNHQYSNFDVDVYLKNGIPIRAFHYADCRITDYKVFTDYDKEEGWFGKGFATLDSFTFTCAGYQPSNPLEESYNQHEKVKTTSSLDLIAKPNYVTRP
ncbi:MAG TPA: hypothetical protein VD699_00170 [Nitrosopumilaceae archaeon]|nr:hypothetical protein [Nitrosopumilaceae archaeon]